jgi:hypothetical protein
MKKKLSGDRNQCPGCGEYFNSTFAFDRHRVGEFGVNRRCLNRAEMLDKGMDSNPAGFWVSERMSADVVSSLAG